MAPIETKMKANGDRPALGYIGLGLMGAPMAGRLLDAGYGLRVWNLTAAKWAPLVERGALSVDSPRVLSEASVIVFMCLTDSKAVEAVVFGPDGVAEAQGTASGVAKILVDFSSMRPDLTRQWEANLRKANGMGWLDAPVSGGVPGAGQGTLAIMAGGEREDFDRAAPVVAHLSQRFTHMGPSGAGQVTKLCNQIISGGTMLLIAEAVALAERSGVDANRLNEALKGGFADSIPLQLLAPRFASRTYEPPLGQLHTMLKDLDTVSDVARRAGMPAPMTAAALALMRRLADEGHADDDITVLCRLYDDQTP